MVRLILSDLDHTLLREDGTISDNTLAVLKRCRDKGILFAIATARYWIGAERYISELSPDYEITTDGTLIHSGSDQIYSCEFSEETTDLIVRLLMSAVLGVEITVACGKTVYWNSPDIASSEKLHKAKYCDYSSPLDVRANKIVAELPDESIARDIASKAGCELQCYRGERWYAFLPEGSGKVSAIKALSSLTGVPLEDMVAFGDDSNDISMLRMCGIGVAVDNALPEVKSAADALTSSNDEDGVASWLRSQILM
ncbi:Cof subfamily of IIB subfamily of haloacid dehalogenase superfamily/HAD-superfamily hydrolase, subfamily IIB [Oscillospiraceae bacterium]|nr:Cof subfamily of IIB subfamily of haloacid dehalogenase superfamily/HAD-superfamily hydrolase, subfamily IIB [Oscillospiraceae bacterium]